MAQLKRKAQGVTLLEIMLVLGVGASILVLAMKTYQTLKSQNDVQSLQTNVELVFIAAAKYYQANCRPQSDPITGVVTAGTGLLAPTTTYNPPNPFPVAMTTLTQGGYLDQTLIPNPILDNSGPSQGYMIQYNQSTPVQSRTMTTSTAPVTTINVGNIIMWRVQVAVKINNPAMAKAYKSLLNADCVSSIVGTTVQACSAAPPGGNYVVWERLPSLASPNADSDYMITNAAVKQFNLLYQTESQQFSAGQTTANKSNYLCGS